MNQRSEPCLAPPLPRFTPKQGQYLAFIHAYTLVMGKPPAHADLLRHFRVTPPSVNQMLITRNCSPGVAARSERLCNDRCVGQRVEL
jgi:hypothetical protein